ncbi:NAD-dependent malic enzyme [Acidipropionibacterium acidipropionici ATCC 4875]|uniref:NAD-dependent malic enzyme n=1 Tax=Acidipropionibacterium acidipropionici (strain ATCC 4875 / DSM 20272 / JCM 6432 / NBRC 12425 / NCIMB 8070 / 4) TaxID=1171373 RepID=K7RJ40_ACIA4|nr:NAD-dependent malic enzyme [Acidipropionibacterium acidipropionici]AFV87889.1 NAD-dependent malic enzyme [Acidipropionibacterium acidipropionici ATCC 4875]
MSDRQSSLFEFGHDQLGEFVRIAARGSAVLADPRINRGSAFTAVEREALDLDGLIPDGVIGIDGQLRQAYRQYLAQPDDLARYLFLDSAHDSDEVLYYRLLADHLEEMLPIVDTPTVGRAIGQYSHWYQRPRGVYLSIDDPDSMEESLLAMGQGHHGVDVVATTDSEAILGLGDQGVGGVAITIGKLAVYTAAGGIHPHRVLPVVLDVGTDNLTLLSDNSYVGVRHSRVRGAQYDEFLERYIETVTRVFPDAMIHWEDFGAVNATRILTEYGDDHRLFNDDIQGTGAVALAALASAASASREHLSDQRIVIFGAGSAGTGIARLAVRFMTQEGLSRADAVSRIWALNSHGLLHASGQMFDYQRPWARPNEELAGWDLDVDGEYGLADVVRHVRPAVLIGCSTVSGAFDEQVVTMMSQYCEHPVIMPLSNPTERAEATPADLLAWTGGRARVVTGSPFAPVELDGVTHRIAQANNALVFPGIGLGVTASRASRVSTGMIAAAARELSRATDAKAPGSSLLPPISGLRATSARVGLAVARTAVDEGLATVSLDSPTQQILDAMWEPEYPRVVVG